MTADRTYDRTRRGGRVSRRCRRVRLLRDESPPRRAGGQERGSSGPGRTLGPIHARPALGRAAGTETRPARICLMVLGAPRARPNGIGRPALGAARLTSRHLRGVQTGLHSPWCATLVRWLLGFPRRDCGEVNATAGGRNVGQALRQSPRSGLGMHMEADCTFSVATPWARRP